MCWLQKFGVAPLIDGGFKEGHKMKYYKLTEHPYKKLAKIAMNKKC